MEELAISRILDQRTEISPRRGRSRGQRSRAKAPSPTPETYWEITVASAAPPPASSSSADDTAPPPASSEPLPEETPEPEQTPDVPAAPVEQTPMEGVYPVASQDDAAALLEQAYTQFAPELTVSFSDQTLTWEERWMLLQNASRTARGPLMEGTAICGGFSWAFRMLCEEAGIPCWNVTGTGAGEEHMWNCARLDGEYRYFDTTWDCGSTDESQWRYFARTEEEFTKSHQWGPGQAALIHQLTEE